MPINNNFWTTEEMILYEFMLPQVRRVVSRGVNDGLTVVSRLVDKPVAQLGVNFELLDRTASTWAQDNTAAVVRQITQTNMDAFLAAFPEWRDSGKPLRFLIDELQKEYGEVRGEMVAVTETTRAYSNGNIISWKSTGLVEGKKWQNVRDNDVSQVCNFLHNKIVPIDAYFIDHNGDKHFCPPGHVRCRSYITPVLSI